MAKLNENRRKVRFNLPETIEKNQNYLPPTKKIKENKIIFYDNKPSVININQKNQINKITYNKNIQQKYKSISLRILPPITFLKPYKSNQTNINQIIPKYEYKEPQKPSYFSIPLSMALSSSKLSNNINNNNNNNNNNINNQRIKHLVILNGTSNKKLLKLNDNKMEDKLKICEYFTRFRIFEDILKQKRKSFKLSEKADRKVFYLKPLRTSVPQANEIGGIENFLQSNENHSRTLADLIQRLKRMRLRENELKINNNILVTNKKDPIESAVLIRSFKSSDVVKRFGSFKMSLEREPSIPTLLRAARDADSYLLKIILKKIINDGITPEVLNETDQNGRTALSYICSTDLIQFLDLLLQLKGIDVNIGDNEGNTPLHYAAQAGQSEIVNMLLTRCRSIQIDVKNCWGFTPMMKAALQGRTRCAKLLLFAGASPVATDSCRRLNAAEWAKITGRESCAEMLEKCSKARNLKPTVVSTKPVAFSPKNLNNIKRSNSLLSKINKLLPFKSSIKDKQTSHNVVNLKNNSPLNNNNNNISVNASGPDTEILNDLEKTTNVPKLIITQQQNDIEFIKKYEKKQIQQKYVTPTKRRVRNEI